MPRVDILDTTLRDGSYVINFGFTTEDTQIIGKGLQDAGVKYIEIGHGLGLGASEKGRGEAAQTDEEYLIAAEEVLDRAEYGMFCIPGIAELTHLDMAARHGMDFVRVGTNVTEAEQAAPFIRAAKDHGMFVAANFMKSYAVAPETFAETAEQAAGYGADMVYIVDSSGGMFPDQVRSYADAVRERCDVALGFHGHNNLDLAVANSLVAAQMGFQYIDSTLQGLGRSAGNAATETLVAALSKLEIDTGIDFLDLIDLGQDFVRPLLAAKGRMPLDLVSGFADFHSSYMHHIRKYASKYHVDPLRLIIEQCKVDKVDVDEARLDAIARTLKPHEEPLAGKYRFHQYFGREQDPPPRA